MKREDEPGAKEICPAARAMVLNLARRSIEAVVRAKALPSLVADEMPETLRELTACFVTICSDGTLRGCIGHLESRLPLWLAVRENAVNAAVNDPRFEPIQEADLPNLQIEVSVLSSPRPIPFSSPQELLSRIRPGRDGVILEVGEARATFLPQVWEKVPDAKAFFGHLAEKACGRKSAWRDPSAQVWVYETETFGDSV